MPLLEPFTGEDLTFPLSLVSRTLILDQAGEADMFMLTVLINFSSYSKLPSM